MEEIGGFLGGLGPYVVRHGLPKGGVAAVGNAPPFGALAAVGTEVGGVAHTGSQVCDWFRGCQAPFSKSFRDLRPGTRKDGGTFLLRQKERSDGDDSKRGRKHLLTLIEQVNNDRQPIEITSHRGDAVLISTADYQALEETAYLLRAPANARRLLESLEQARSCQ